MDAVRRFDPIEKRATSFFACQADPRFSYCLAVPRGFDERGTDRRRLVVVVHGTRRNAEQYRDDYVAFADETDAVVLAPMFPAGIVDPDDVHNYKFMRYRGIRYDHVLLAMVEEVAAKYRLDAYRFALHGFSGGGQFSHRFHLLHPRRLIAVSSGAPGMVTLLDGTCGWWVGTRDVAEVFGAPLDLEAIRAVPAQVIVGEDDLDTSEITITPDRPDWWMEGANDAGVTRVDRARALARNLEAHGVSVRLDVVPGRGHEGIRMQPVVRDFLRGHLRATAPALAEEVEP